MGLHKDGNTGHEEEETGHEQDHRAEDDKFFMDKLKSVVLSKLLSEVRGTPFGGEFQGGPGGGILKDMLKDSQSDNEEPMARIVESRTLPIKDVPKVLKKKGLPVPEELTERIKKLRKKAKK